MAMSNMIDMTRGVYRLVYSGFISGRRLNSVALPTEAWFWRLHAVADDYGNLPGDPTLVRNLTAGRRDVSLGAVEAFVAELVGAGLLIPYEAKGEKMLHVAGWLGLQRPPRNGRRIRRYAAFDGESAELALFAGVQDHRDAGSPGESGGVRGKPGESGGSDSDSESDTHSESVRRRRLLKTQGDGGTTNRRRAAAAAAAAAERSTQEGQTRPQGGAALSPSPFPPPETPSEQPQRQRRSTAATEEAEQTTDVRAYGVEAESLYGRLRSEPFNVSPGSALRVVRDNPPPVIEAAMRLARGKRSPGGMVLKFIANGDALRDVGDRERQRAKADRRRMIVEQIRSASPDRLARWTAAAYHDGVVSSPSVSGVTLCASAAFCDWLGKRMEEADNG